MISRRIVAVGAVGGGGGGGGLESHCIKGFWAVKPSSRHIVYVCSRALQHNSLLIE